MALSWGSGSSLNSAELYDPTTATWSPTASLTNVRLEHTATLLPNGQVLVAGGVDNSGVLVVDAAAGHP